MRRLFILLLILTACRTTETITKTVIEKDTVYQVKLRDTTLFRTDTVFQTKEGTFSLDTVTAEGRYSSAEAWVANSLLELRLREGKSAGKDTVYIEGKKEVETVIKEVIKKVPRELTNFDLICRGSFFLLCFLALIVVIFVRFRR
jgi:hypothetical protein